MGLLLPLEYGLTNQMFCQRARAYLLSDANLDTPIWGRADFGCNCYASGELSFQEALIPRAYRAILKYFETVAANPDYEEVPQNIPDPREEGEGAGKGADMTEEERVQATLAAMKVDGHDGENFSVEVKHNPEP